MSSQPTHVPSPAPVAGPRATSRRFGIRDIDDGDGVTTLELFFDLVFVFALTQVTALMAADGDARGLFRGFILLALLWFAWTSFAWLGNQAKADEGLLRFAMVLTMGALFLVALAIPESFDDRPGGLYGPLVLAAAYVGVRLIHVGIYLVVAGSDTALRRRLLVTSMPMLALCGFLLVGGAVGPPWQSMLWVVGLVVDYAGMWLAGTDGWRLTSPKHFAERHGLIVIVALGESIVALGVGVTGQPVTWAVLLAALLGLGVSVGLWWVYFDAVALVAERVLSRLEGRERMRVARDSYSYLHFPMLLGIVYLALGMKKVLTYVADSAHHEVSDALPWVESVALFGGATVYLLALSLLRRRNIGRWNVQRLLVAGVLVALLPVAVRIPALASLAMLTALLGGLISYEAGRMAVARGQIRHQNG